MELTLIRHAIAEDRRNGLADERRALTRKGRARFRASVRGLAALGVSFDQLLHSPARRAVETAELCAELVDGETIVTELLWARADERLLASLTGERVALVGHEPWLSELAAWLMTGWRECDAESGSAPFALKKGGVLCLSGTPRPGGMTLREAFVPRTLRKLGKR